MKKKRYSVAFSQLSSLEQYQYLAHHTKRFSLNISYNKVGDYTVTTKKILAVGSLESIPHGNNN